ncbi:hypothetical protein [Streptomyces hesseae]|uniref:Uncharacterized protein n=1 Tax=Streptomyces hesseae TaxID=3075519 RepID=A0ABU2SMM2_9ACTN|nr:hypothetical protein [Streptomyces sp. DSM 40473]MDT0450142.1 hypothetical protein [Streptomyces sp. DSM 40473]
MSIRAPRTLTLLALAAALTAPAAVPAVAASPAGGEPPITSTSSLTGWGRMDYPMPGNDIRVTVDARSSYGPGHLPVRSDGTFRISHRTDAMNGQPASDHWGEFTVDCLTTGGPVATVTGRLVRTDAGGPWEKAGYLKRHIRMGVSFYVADGKNGGPSRIGLSGGTEKSDLPLKKCMAPAPDSGVVAGGYTLKDRTPAR